MPRIRVTTAGLVGAWVLSCVPVAPLAYWWGREASGWEPPPPGMIQGADTNEILTVLPYALARFGLLMLSVTAFLLYLGRRHAEPKRRRQ